MRHKTGEKCPKSGTWEWDGWLDGSWSPVPSHAARYIPLSAGETFPPCDGRGCYWKFRSDS